MGKLLAVGVGMAGYILALASAEGVKRAFMAEADKTGTGVAVLAADRDRLPVGDLPWLPLGEGERPGNIRYRINPAEEERRGKKSSKPYLRYLESCFKKR